ncbi:MAG: response regulator transcription factor [Gemmatimonadetes bacterium]|nr:response regulator transcription factor [Gemmatimonadota bacterium]
MSASIRVLVADDHAVVREGIRTVLEGVPGFHVVAEAATGEEALAILERQPADVAVIDVSMPGMSGLELIRALRARSSHVGTLVLSMHDHSSYVLEAMRAGADGYLLKSAAPAEVREAVRTVAAGGEYYSADLTRLLGAALRDERARDEVNARLASLTPREREVLALVCGGCTSREVGEALSISPRTVETHRENVAKKLGIRTVAGLTRFAIETGLIPPRSNLNPPTP